MKLTYLMATSGSTLSEGLRMYHYIQPLASYVSNDGKLMKFNGWQLRMSKTPSFDDAVATFKADLL